MAVRIGDVHGFVRIPKAPSAGPRRQLVGLNPVDSGESGSREFVVNTLAVARFTAVEDASFAPAPRPSARRELVSPRLDVITTDSERVLVLEHARVGVGKSRKKLDLYRFHRHDSPDVPQSGREVVRPFKRLASPARAVSDFQAFSAPSSSVPPDLTSRLMLRTGSGWRLVDPSEKLPVKSKTIVMIHGFLSKIESAFQNVDFVGAPADALVLGYDHETVFKSPAENADDLIKLLKRNSSFGGKAQTLDVIAHSRGGLVAREFLNKIAASHSSEWNIGRLSTYGSPNQGTTLAVDGLDILNIAVNAAIRGFLPELPTMFSSMISEIATHGALPGIDAMTPVKASAIASSFGDAEVLCLESTYSPRSDEWAKRLASFLWRTAAFRGNSNDLVVDVPYMGLGAATLAEPVEDHNHFRYFDPGYHGNRPF